MYRIYKCKECGATKTITAHSYQTNWQDFVGTLPATLRCYLNGCNSEMPPYVDSDAAQ